MRRVYVGLVAAAFGAMFASACSEKKAEPGEDTPTAGDKAGSDKTAGDKAGQDKAAPASLEKIAEVEPNDKTSQAMEIKKSCEVEATLEPAAKKKARASDWYKVITGGKKKVAFELSGIPEEDVRLVFRDADRNELFYVDSGKAGEGERYPNLVVGDAVYVKVDGDKGGKGGAYKLGIRFSDPVEGEEDEYNGRYSTANDLAVGGSVKGYLASDRDEDWYLLPLTDLPTGSVLRIELTGVEGVSFHFVASDREERRPLMEVKSKAGEGVVIRNMGVPAGAEAIYLTVKSGWVPGAKPKKYERTSNPDVAYTLSVSSEAGGDDLEKEPNDKAEDAMPIADGQKLRGYLSRADDDDWYKIQVDRASILSAELSALNRVDLQLYVVDPEKKDAKRNYELVRINDGKVNEPEVLTNCALAAGENYIKINGAWKKVDGKWVQDDFNLDETYTLTVNLRTDEGREEREPNDKVEQATSMAAGDSLRGTLHPKGDVDVFKLDLSSQDGPRTTTIECTGIPKVDIRLKLLGPELDEKGKHKVVETSSKGKGEEKEQISKELMPGEYWIVVSGPRFGESNTSDQYVLTVTQ